jgi:SAM-dependent methyltransferase
MPRKRKPIALHAYEKIAEEYAALVDDRPENAYFERPATLSLMPHVGGKRVLDAGCGPGRYAEWLLERGAEVVGVDVSRKMIRQAGKRVGKRADLHVADLGAPLDFLESRSFDIVLATLVLDYIEDWKPLFEEFNRVLKGFGVLVFCSRHPFGHFDMHAGSDYFTTEYVEDLWEGFGTPVVVPCYRRPMGTIISTLVDTGFALERLLEPRPGEEVRTCDPGVYDRLNRLPGLICVRARKTTA